VFSVTSWSELARDGRACEQRARESVCPEPSEGARAGSVAALRRFDRLRTGQAQGEPGDIPFVAQQLAAGHGPVIAATDYVCAVPEAIRAFVPQGRRYVTLGTDGFGRSDTRAALRKYFGVDAASIVRAARHALSLRA
jgi:pyruvate dehydrogenase E1 component